MDILSVIIQAIDPPKSKSRPTVISSEEGRRMKTPPCWVSELADIFLKSMSKIDFTVFLGFNQVVVRNPHVMKSCLGN